MKKLLVVLMTGMMISSMVTGCGKTEEEKAFDEVSSHMEAEAKADGVDLEAELQDEYNAVQERSADREDAKTAYNNVLLEYEEKITDAHNRYDAAIDTNEIVSAAQEYNELVQKEKDELSTVKGYEYTSTHAPLYEGAAYCKGLYYSAAKGYAGEYEKMSWVYTADPAESYILLEKQTEDLDFDQALIIRADGSELTLKMADIDPSKENPTISILSETQLMITCYSEDFMTNYYYIFDISGNEVAAPQIMENQCPESIMITGATDMEITDEMANSCASNSYQR
ncbi:MAG: hypothetical protein EOM40_05265 [Clostridia bacterium]|nr:hypothetical protein [Clostridia bacterium]NCC44482.1 hypothetical protein [Clostridia bacterium]